MDSGQVDLLLRFGGADVSGDVQVVVVVLDLLQRDPAGIALFFLAVLVGVDDFVNVLGQELILSLALLVVLGGIDEEHVIGLFALFQHQDAHRSAGGEEQIGR